MGAPAGAVVPKPTVSNFVGSTTSLYRDGGVVTLSAAVTNAVACTFRANHPLAGMPASDPCSSGVIQQHVTLPPNTTKKVKTYIFKLRVSGTTNVSPTNSVAVTVGITAPPVLDNVTAIAAGLIQTCALKSDTSVWCWGDNGTGELGNATNSSSNVPVKVSGTGGSGFLTGVTAITSGWYHTCALMADSTVRCWGDNAYGELGNGTNNQSNVPVTVLGQGGTGVLSGVKSISAGYYQTCALLANQTVLCWGDNGYGELGSGTGNTTVPVPVTGLSGATAVDADWLHTCALTNGTAQCWGYNYYGELGNGTPSGVTALAAGYRHTCVLLANTSLQCWGWNGYGELGNGSNIDSSSPVVVSGTGGAGMLSGVAAITAGWLHTCALMSNTTVQCWGNNDYGELGNQAGSTNVPIVVTGSNGTGVLSGVTAISAEYLHTCVLMADTTVKCFGAGGWGELGNGANNNSNVPVTVSAP